MPVVNPKKGDVISFQFVKNGLIGDGKQGVKVVGDVEYSVAKAIDPELNVKHQQLYPYFKDAVGNVNDPATYDYVSIMNANGVLEVIGIPWILASSFTYVQNIRRIINVLNWQPAWQPALESFMAGLGANYTTNDFTNSPDP